jgi:hypothetical protein
MPKIKNKGSRMMNELGLSTKYGKSLFMGHLLLLFLILRSNSPPVSLFMGYFSKENA